MRKLQTLSQKPAGQVLLATLLFSFIFCALFVGLYKSGSAYLAKERSRRAVNLTTLTGGAVYANGLQLVREANVIIMAAATYDAGVIAKAIGKALLAPPPLDVVAVAAAVAKADPGTRKIPQDICSAVFGVDTPTGLGAYPALIEGQAFLTAHENRLSSPPFFAYNYETSTNANIVVPNMALRFRRADELLPDEKKAAYSLMHDGVRTYFSSNQVESARNPRHPHQMRVRKHGPSVFAGWWVRREKDGSEGGMAGHNPLSVIPGISKLKGYLHKIKLDITDRDDPPCHTFSSLGNIPLKFDGAEKNLYEAGEVRVETDGLDPWDIKKPFEIYLVKVNVDAFPVLRDAVRKLQGIPILNQILRSSDLLNGI